MTIRRLLAIVLLWQWADAAAARLGYSARLSADARHLAVSMCSDLAIASGVLVSGRSNAVDYLDHLNGDGDSQPRITRRGIEHGALAAGECLRYTVDAYAAARADRYQLSWREGDYVMLPLQLWLWRPQQIPAGSWLELSLPRGWTGSLPYAPLAAGVSAFALVNTPADWDATSAFGRLLSHQIKVPGGAVRLAVLPPTDVRQNARLQRWAEQNVRALLAANGRFPLPSVQVLVVPLPGVATAVPWGQVTRGGGSALKLFVGLDASEESLRDDWTLAHEFSHLLHPYLRTHGRWLGEGLASYYQNVLRARSGALTAEQAWSKLDAGFARGEAEPNHYRQTLSAAAQGGYRSTMRVYWSGAAFWLEAELALRQQGGGDLADVLDAFARRHLPSNRQWRPERFVSELDAVAGTAVFAPLFARYERATAFPPLGDVYRQLGLGEDVGRLLLTDAAPAADIREAIMHRSHSLGQQARPAASADDSNMEGG